MLKNGSESALEALRSRFRGVFDIGTVLQYNFADFFDFCRYLGYYGYKPDGFDGRLQAPADFVKHHIGNCWDQTELQREWFEKHGYQVQTFLLYYYVTDNLCPSHSILTYQKDRKWYWFEPMCYGENEDYVGVHKYASRSTLLEDFKTVFMRFGQQLGILPDIIDTERWSLYRYLQPKYGISDLEFYDFCRTGRRIW